MNINNQNQKEKRNCEIKIDKGYNSIISKGDNINICEEEFNVIYIDNEKTVALAKYNLNVGENIKEGKVGIQNIQTRGWLKEIEKEYKNHFPGAVSFSNKNYWVEDNKYDKNYPINIYDTEYQWNEGNKYSVSNYVENYKKYLTEELGVNILNIRLLYYDEAVNIFGCGDHICPTTGINSFITNTSFWIGTARDDISVWYIDSDGDFYFDYYNSNFSRGVRPVIELLNTEIK